MSPRLVLIEHVFLPSPVLMAAISVLAQSVVVSASQYQMLPKKLVS